MGIYKFEVKSLIKVKKEAVNLLDARLKVIDDIEDGFLDDELHAQSEVSNGKEI